MKSGNAIRGNHKFKGECVGILLRQRKGVQDFFYHCFSIGSIVLYFLNHFNIKKILKNISKMNFTDGLNIYNLFPTLKKLNFRCYKSKSCNNNNNNNNNNNIMVAGIEGGTPAEGV
jgi:hypothetical protein